MTRSRAELRSCDPGRRKTDAFVGHAASQNSSRSLTISIPQNQWIDDMQCKASKLIDTSLSHIKCNYKKEIGYLPQPLQDLCHLSHHKGY